MPLTDLWPLPSTATTITEHQPTSMIQQLKQLSIQATENTYFTEDNSEMNQDAPDVMDKWLPKKDVSKPRKRNHTFREMLYFSIIKIFHSCLKSFPNQ
jgi:hypothetical protein